MCIDCNNDITLPVGPKGDKGDTGDPGATGASGTDGTDGSIIHFGVGIPSNSLGNNGDMYIDTIAPYNFYNKTGGTWL